MKRTPPKARDASRHLRKIADPVAAKTLRGFFKTKPGQYAEKETFIGIKTEPLRQAARLFADMPLDQIDLLIQSNIHEERTLGLKILSLQYTKGDARQRERLYRHYLKRTRLVNQWDFVDDSAPAILGRHLLDGDMGPLRKLAVSSLWWERRIAIVATYHFIRNDRFDFTIELAAQMLRDEHDLMHKAVGWMLREIGKRDEAVLRRFLNQHGIRMPRTMLRYAIERFSDKDRRHYMKR